MPDKQEEIRLAINWYLEKLKKEKYYGGLTLTFKEGVIVFVRKDETLITDTIIFEFKSVVGDRFKNLQ